MSDLQELYQQVVIDHYKHPRNYKKVEGANRTVEGYNPLCGDHLWIHMKVEDGVVKDVGFEGSGCAISKSSASLMTEAVKGKRQDEIEVIFRQFQDMVTGKAEPDPDKLGKLAIFGGVRDFPTRVKCAILGWHTLKAALSAEDGTTKVSTE